MDAKHIFCPRAGTRRQDKGRKTEKEENVQFERFGFVRIEKGKNRENEKIEAFFTRK